MTPGLEAIVKAWIIALALVPALASGAGAAWAAPVDFSLSLAGGASLPLGEDREVFADSYGGSIGAGLRPAQALPLEARLRLDFSSAPIAGAASGDAVSIARLLVGAAFTGFRLGPLAIEPEASVGAYGAFLSDYSAFNPVVEAGLGLSFGAGAFRPLIKVGYAYDLGLSQGLTLQAGIAFRPGALGEAGRRDRAAAEAALPSDFSIVAQAEGRASPFGSDGEVFAPSLGGSIGAALRLAPELPLEGRAEFGFSSGELRGSGDYRLSLGRFLLGLEFEVLRLGPLGLGLGGAAGFYRAYLSEGSAPAFNPELEAGIRLVLGRGAARPAIELAYVNDLGLSQSLALRAGFVIRPGAFRNASASAVATKAEGGPSPLAAEGQPAVASSLGLRASGGAALPLGDDASLFGPALGASIGAGLRLFPGLPLEARAELSLGVGPLDLASSSFSLETARLLVGPAFAGLELGPLSLSAELQGGGFAAFLSDGSGPAFNPSAGAALEIGFGKGALRPVLRASYIYDLGLSQGLSIQAGIASRVGASAPASIPPSAPKPKEKAPKPAPAPKPLILKSGPAGFQVIGLELDTLFPVFFRYYEDHPIGYLVVRNGGKAAIEAVQADLFVKQFMDNPKECQGPTRLEPGAEARVPLYALFNDAILSVSEGNKVSGSVAIGYSSKGKPGRLDLTTAISLYDRNATNWSDDRRAAAFVTAKDPVVLKFSKNLAGFIDDAKRYSAPKAFAAALGVFESLRAYGMRYVIDPNASYVNASANEAAVDFIQFPRQTLDFKAGDCDDLSVLSAALLESIGAKAAFITVPGHIYVAADLELPPDEARKRYIPDTLVIQGDRAWLPFEVTALAGDFLKAWDAGAREWREAASKGLAQLYPVAEAWAVYAPVGFVSETVQVQPPEAGAIGASCRKLLERYVERELGPAVAKVEAEMKGKEGRSPRLLNKLGLLYAQAGLRDAGRAAFAEAASREEFAPALLNLGNLAFLEKDFEASLGYFERAYRRSPQDPRVLLGMARANHELENYGQARDYFGKLKKADAALAGRFAYIELRGEESARAADAAGLKEVVVWSE